MRSVSIIMLPLLQAVCLSWLSPVAQAQTTEPSQLAATPAVEEEMPVSEIEAALADYQAAFDAGDVEAFKELWTSDPVYSIVSTGERIRGVQAIAELFQAVRQEQAQEAQLSLETNAIQFVSPHVALVDGRALVRQGPDDEPALTVFSSVYVRQGDKWLLDRVTEEEAEPEPISHYEQLQPLEWMIGDWIDAEAEFTIEMTCDWTANRNFISRRFKVTGDTSVLSSGLQIIGWDAKEKTIRSWLFDSGGGVVTGTWLPREESWHVQSVATLADGSSASFTSVFKPLEDGNYLWSRINQVVDGQLLPNVEEVVVRRQ